MESWRGSAAADTSEHVALQFARLEEVTRQGFESGDYDLILKAHDRIARLLGLDRPARSEIAMTSIQHGIVPFPEGVNPEG